MCIRDSGVANHGGDSSNDEYDDSGMNSGSNSTCLRDFQVFELAFLHLHNVRRLHSLKANNDHKMGTDSYLRAVHARSVSKAHMIPTHFVPRLH